MRTVFVALLFWIISTLSGHADYFEYKVYDRVVALSRDAIPGKVSVFIIGTSWCGPCKGLVERLKHESRFSMNFVDLYYLEIADNKSMKNPSFQYWNKIEEVRSFPTVYILAQTTTVAAKYSDESDMFGKTVRVVNSLLKDGKGFSSKLLVTLNKDNDSQGISPLFLGTVKTTVGKKNGNKVPAKPSTIKLSAEKENSQKANDVDSLSVLFTIRVARLSNKEVFPKDTSFCDIGSFYILEDTKDRNILCYGRFYSESDARNSIPCVNKKYPDAFVIKIPFKE